MDDHKCIELPSSQGPGKLIHCAHEAEQGKIEGALEDLETEPCSLIPNSTLNSNLEHDVDNLPGLYLYIRDLGTFLTAVISLIEQVS